MWSGVSLQQVDYDKMKRPSAAIRRFSSSWKDLHAMYLHRQVKHLAEINAALLAFLLLPPFTKENKKRKKPAFNYSIVVIADNSILLQVNRKSYKSFILSSCCNNFSVYRWAQGIRRVALPYGTDFKPELENTWLWTEKQQIKIYYLFFYWEWSSLICLSSRAEGTEGNETE